MKKAREGQAWEDVIDELCRCGHRRSEHMDTVAKGHGGCLKPECGCVKFTWKSFVYRQARTPSCV